MEARKRLDRLHLDDDKVVDGQIQAVASVKPQAFELSRKRHLAAHPQTTTAEFVSEAVLIGGLKQSRAERTMNLQSRVHDLPARDLRVRRNGRSLFVVLASFVVFVIQ